jgi:hypothetical protein
VQGYEDAQSRQAIVSVRRELQQMLRSPLLMTEYGGRYPTMLGHLPEPVLRPGQAKNMLFIEDNSDSQCILTVFLIRIGSGFN